MMTSPIQLVEKIDDFAVNDSISEIAFLTKGLLQLQHARYPHLVPMYRTVHRKIPRAMVFRAIRWVNPKRMFPGAGLTKEQMMNMSEDELRKLAVTLNDYRGEAHVIHNRYNEMLEMIQMGELPYYIPYAGFKQDKWTMLQEYKDRALRLKEGTEEWESVLDNQAVLLRQILKKEHDVRFDDIDGLWQNEGGKDRAPNFYDPKKGKEKKQFLRKVRNGELVDPPKVYARKYMAVPAAEIRKGEEVRMPAGGQVRRPADKRGRKIFDEFGGAADHLLRMPRGPFLGSQKTLRERGNLISMPAGRKNPLIVTYNEIPADAVANRRVGRWTQPDPLKRRGQARHRGESSAVTGGHPAEPVGGGVVQPPWAQPGTASAGLGPQTRAGADIANVEENIRDAARGMPEAGTASEMNQKHQDQEALIVKNGGQRFVFRGPDDLDLSNITADDVVSAMPMVLGDDGKARADGGGGGIGSWTTFRLKLTDGSTVLYKQVPGEQDAETFTTTVDRILGLNVVAGSTNNVLGMQAIFGKLGGKTDPQELQDFAFDVHDALRNNAYGSKKFDTWERELRIDGRKGFGHIMEFCEPNCTTWAKASTNSQGINNLVQDPDKRQGIHKIALLDFITGNSDRHRGNFMMTENDELVAIDNGFSGGKAEFAKGFHNQEGMLWPQGPMYGNSSNHIKAGDIINKGGGDLTEAKAEVMKLFDDQVTQSTLDDLIASGQLIGINAKTTDLVDIKANFEKWVDKIYQVRGSIL